MRERRSVGQHYEGDSGGGRRGGCTRHALRGSWPRLNPPTHAIVRTLSLLALLPLLAGCSLFGNDFTMDFVVEVESVQEIQDASGTQIVCSVVISATAVGNDGDMGTFGESVWTFSSIATGAELSREGRSSAFIGQIFRTMGVEAGATETTSPVERTVGEPFEWHFEFNYRDPGRARQTTEAMVRCEP